MYHRDRIHQRAKLDPENSILRICYMRYHNFFIDLLRKVKIRYEENEILKNKNKSKKLWKSIKCFYGVSEKREEPTELLSMKDAKNACHLLDICNDHFSTVGQRLANQILPSIKKSENDLANAIKTMTTPAECCLLQIIKN